MSYNFEELKLFTTELVKRAGEISIKYFNQRDYKKSTKLDGSIVTQADEEIEKLVRDKISQNYPEHNILGEEFGEINNNSDYCWYIDPIDGTKAFAEQIPTFGVMTALTYKDNPFFSVIYQPITKELWLGLLGNKQNIFLYQKDDLDIKIENDQEFDQNKLKVATTSLDLLDAQGNEVFEKISKVAEKIIVGGDCYNYCKLASNEIDVVFEQGLKPYDLAPLIPIIKSSGSIICDEKGLDIKLSKSPSGNIFAFKNQKTKDFIFENILQID